MERTRAKQKTRAFSRDRIAAELDLIGRHRTVAVNLCDANFGMAARDEQFVTDLLAVKEKYGYPQALQTPWGKVISEVFWRVVRAVYEGGLFASFLVSMQSTNPEALRLMRRSNMSEETWFPLVEFCRARELPISSELIWGLPGETAESFLNGFDQVARQVDRISCYELLLMPNTEYWERRDELKIIAKRGESDDYHTVLSHETISLEDNHRMHRFLFWQKVLHDFCTFRYIWRPLATLGKISCSSALLSLDAWLEDHRQVEAIDRLLVERDRAARDLDTARSRDGVRALFRSWCELEQYFVRWFEDLLRSVEAKPILVELFRFDRISMPIYDPTGKETITLEGVDVPVYIQRDVSFAYDMEQVAIGAPALPVEYERTFLYPSGFAESLSGDFGAALGGAFVGRPFTGSVLQTMIDGPKDKD